MFAVFFPPVTRLFGAILIAVSLSAAAQPAEPSPKGSLAIIGGALRVDNAAIWQRVVALAGGKGAKIAVFPSASSSPENAASYTMGVLRRYGAEPFAVPASVSNKELDYRVLVNDPKWVEQVRHAGGVYFTGGDQGRITRVLVNEDGSRTPMLEAIWDVYKRGGVVAGTSAGAAIMSTTMFYDAMGVLPTLKLGVNEGKEIAPGLGFIGPDVFVDQHLLIRGRFARMLPAMLKANYKYGLGVDENTAMIVTNGADIELVGYKGALLIDLSQATTAAELDGFNITNARLSYLDQGDRYNIKTRVFKPSSEKENGRVRSGAPYFNDARYYTDIIGNTTVVDLLQHLIDSRQNSTIGLAFGAPDSIMPTLGFEFKFSKTEESVGYFSSASGGEAYSVLNIRLDVRPIEMHQPLYHYR